MRAGRASFFRPRLNLVTAVAKGIFNSGMFTGGRRRTKGIENNGAGAPT